jgi:hypothetical protein
VAHGDGSNTGELGELIGDQGHGSRRRSIRGRRPSRPQYTTGDLEQDVRITGEPKVQLTIRPQGAVGQVGVALVDYGTQVRVKDDGEGNTTLGTESCWGASTSYDDSCYFDSIENLLSTPLASVARGWARLVGNQTNTLTVHLAYNDVVIRRRSPARAGARRDELEDRQLMRRGEWFEAENHDHPRS